MGRDPLQYGYFKNFKVNWHHWKNSDVILYSTFNYSSVIDIPALKFEVLCFLTRKPYLQTPNSEKLG